MITAAPAGVLSYGTDTLGKDDKTNDGESKKGQFGVPSAAMAITELGWHNTIQD